MRTLPASIAINKVPDDFDPVIADTSKPTDPRAVLKWSGTISGLKYELGLRPARSDSQIDQAKADLRYGAWQLQELARLGRADLMTFALATRHQQRF